MIHFHTHSSPHKERQQQSSPVNSHKKYFTLDLLRAFATLCVILVHTTERVYQFNLEAMPSYTLQRQLFALTLFTIGRMGVPIFLFLTGYLLLNRTYNKEYTSIFYRRNFLCLLITSEIWIVLYNVFNSWFYRAPFRISELLRNMFFLKETNMSHMWYIPVILGLYLFIPFVSHAISESIKEDYPYFESIIQKFLLCGIFFYLYVIPELNIIFQCNGAELFSILPSFDFSGGVYGFHLILGFLICKRYFRRIPVPLCFCIGMSCFFLTVWLQFYSYQRNVGYNVWYNNATLLITCLMMFEYISRYEDEGTSMHSTRRKAFFNKFRSGVFGKTIQTIARCSFGIYLIHNPINMLLIRFFHTESAVLRLAIIGSMTFLFSFVIVWILCKNKYIAKILFNTNIVSR